MLEAAVDRHGVLFRNFPGGVHKTSILTLHELRQLTRVKVNDTCWDIGCGEGLLATYFSVFTKTAVYANDTSKFFSECEVKD